MALRWLMFFWPGMSAAWGSGSFRGLAVALVFIFAMQAAWVGTFIWPALLTSWEVNLLWWTLAVSVVGSVFYQACYVPWAQIRGVPRCDDLVLRQAQAFYLRGSYFEAEELLAPHVSQGEMDVEAALWLASIYRRTGRFEAALVVLQAVETLERGGVWAEEIAQEHQKIKEFRRNKRLESL